MSLCQQYNRTKMGTLIFLMLNDYLIVHVKFLRCNIKFMSPKIKTSYIFQSKNHWRVKFLAGQVCSLARHCLLTSRYFKP